VSSAKARRGRGTATTGGPAREAWGRLAQLVYPPPFLAVARKLDLRPASLGTLRVLDEPRPMGEIAHFLHCDSSNVTGIVDGLEERGLVRREPSPKDRRVKLIALTAEGRRVRARLMKEVEMPPAWLESLSEADQRTLGEILGRANVK